MSRSVSPFDSIQTPNSIRSIYFRLSSQLATTTTTFLYFPTVYFFSAAYLFLLLKKRPLSGRTLFDQDVVFVSRLKSWSSWRKIEEEEKNFDSVASHVYHDRIRRNRYLSDGQRLGKKWNDSPCPMSYPIWPITTGQKRRRDKKKSKMGTNNNNNNKKS